MISLSAEQKNLSKLFTQREQYIIPDFQRPYSWELDQCRKLYDDLIEAYNQGKDYFLGNIIEAIGEKQTAQPNIVDGQQRLITLWLMFKSLHMIFPTMKVLEDTLTTKNWDGSCQEIKIKSEVIETLDWKDLLNVLEWDQERIDHEYILCKDKYGEFAYPSNRKRIEANCLFFYNAFLHFNDVDGENELKQFIKFVLEDVSMLPIILTDTNIENARNKALTIFETINDRGLDLADADIFKARLFVKAIDESQKSDFKSLWAELKRACKDLKLEIDDVFRYYSHILRGMEGNVRNEISLREFFTTANSPISQKTYKEIMSDLLKITDLLSEYKERKGKNDALAAWLQIIDAYTNNYPKYAVITYLFHYGFENQEELIENLKSIVRYCYFKGSTTYVKFEIYNMVHKLSCSPNLVSYKLSDVSDKDFDYLGRLKYAYALLAMYLETGIAIQNYGFDRLLTNRDADCLSSDWKAHKFEDHLDDLGNLAVIDTYRCTKPYKEKQKAYIKTSITELKSYLTENPQTITYKSMAERTSLKKELLLRFFKAE